jgi:hypothetical protein
MVPLEGVSSAPIKLSSVVLPDPDGPMSATNSPASTLSEKSSRACVSTNSVR